LIAFKNSRLRIDADFPEVRKIIAVGVAEKNNGL
jgi:hypothetical protein